MDFQQQLSSKNKDITTLYINLLTNKAQSELNLKLYNNVIETTKDVFRQDEDNSKGHYRRGQAYKALAAAIKPAKEDIAQMKEQQSLLEKAKQDYQKVISIEKNNPKI